ncbi:MAG: T9SS type A sorting domain-containing protein, partial [Bacteroidota bacterium]
TSTASDFLVFRLDTTGTLDLDFNTTGFKTQPLASSVTAEEAYGMGIMADDRILLAGTIIFSSAVNEDVGIVMLKADSVVPSTVATINSFPIQLYPNPFDSDGFVLDLTIPSSTKLITEIHDVFGRLVFTRNDELIAGSQQIRYNNLNLSKGFYTVSCFMSDSIIGNFKVIAR